MARTIDDRLRDLRSRRTGLDRLDDVALDARATVLAKSLTPEIWESRQSKNQYTRYTLGAMQPVGSEYTEITVETARRVGRQLETKLTQDAEFRLQGSVPLNVHIRGVSDVDLLVIDTCMFKFDTHGCLAHTYIPTDRSRLQTILELRRDSEVVLESSYPAVRVDCSGGKAISMRGGSLPRPVDVVPSIWHNTAEYQASSAEHDRGVVIADKNVPIDIENRPFLHIKRINDANDVAGDGLKKAIRLTKNVKSDSDRAEVKYLSSFDIASLLYHADKATLALGRFYELAVLAEVQRFFDWVYHNETSARQLRTPDGSRAVLDTSQKYQAARSMSCEIDDLAKRVAMEQAALTEDALWSDRTRVLKGTVIP